MCMSKILIFPSKPCVSTHIRQTKNAVHIDVEYSLLLPLVENKSHIRHHSMDSERGRGKLLWWHIGGKVFIHVPKCSGENAPKMLSILKLSVS